LSRSRAAARKRSVSVAATGLIGNCCAGRELLDDAEPRFVQSGFSDSPVAGQAAVGLASPWGSSAFRGLTGELEVHAAANERAQKRDKNGVVQDSFLSSIGPRCSTTMWPCTSRRGHTSSERVCWSERIPTYRGRQPEPTTRHRYRPISGRCSGDAAARTPGVGPASSDVDVVAGRAHPVLQARC